MKKQIYVLPWLRITTTQYGNDPLVISNATFYSDSPEVWQETLQLPRPVWLDIFRDFHVLDHEQEPKPARGTIIVSDDDDWLREHISRLIGVLYVIGEDCRRWQIPSDAFNYRGFFASNETKPMVTFHSKTSSKTEDLSSLQLTPGLELRGVNPNFRADLTVPENQKLIELFEANPRDRLAVASYHLFRTQFEDPVVAPSEQDIAGYCACLEAAFDIRRPKYSKKLSDRLAENYGEPKEFRRWIKGFYAERSVFNHGATSVEAEGDGDRILTEFRNRRLSWDMLRRICLDVIQDQLKRKIAEDEHVLSRLMNPTKQMLYTVFKSEKIWTEIATIYTQTKAVDRIKTLRGSDKADFESACYEFVSVHSWKAINEVDKSKLLKVLMAMGAVVYELSKDSKPNDAEAGKRLFDIAKASDYDAIDTWAREFAGWDQPHSDSALMCKSVAAHAARYFCEN